MAAQGDVDIARVAGLMAEPSRAKVLMALGDGRSLPAGTLAAEAGVSAQTMSAHLARLVDGGLVTVERSGRFRYYRLARPEVGEALEALCRIAPLQPVRSLRQGTRANALRRARTCYDHMAGRLGVGVAEALLRRGAVVRVDGLDGLGRRPQDRFSAPVVDQPYRMGPEAGPVLAELGLDVEELAQQRTRRPLLRACVDWTEQQHHFSGRLGQALLAATVDRGWVEHTPRHRALRVTDQGRAALAEFGCADAALGLSEEGRAA